jgi:tetratricopeptide (TPR) repeat protein/O-antigen ligase
MVAAAAIIHRVEGLGSGAQTGGEPPDSARASPGRWQRLRDIPLSIPVLLYVLVFLLTTVTSIMPLTSFWGSYQRLQGTYTNLSYVALGVIVALNLKRREQLERLITVMVLGSLPAIGYGLVQHFQIDPLPWRGDVVTRVASTMGNSIFVAAYLILIVPFALYRALAALHEARQAPPSERQGAEVGWAAAYTLLVVGALAIVFSAIQFGAVVRSADLGYWWVYPGALLVAFALFLLPALCVHTADRSTAAVIWPAALTLSYVLLLGGAFVIDAPPVRAQPGASAGAWFVSLVAGIVLVGAAYALILFLPRAAAPSRLWLSLEGAGMLTISVLLLVTIFFTQSRGPWIGLGAGLVVFFTLLLIQGRRRALAEGSPRASLWRNLLIAELSLAVVLGGLVAAFNLSDAPVFQQLRQVPYIGRMGTLLETESGTGLVRRLIWIGDEQAGGAVELITSNPLRTLIGYGPESMFIAFNKFYPPSLANVESRGASPDRSHQAYLDELVTKGLLGLISYLFVLISFFALAWRLVRRSDEWRMQVLFIACIAVAAAHAVEGLTGIPIVATLMILWLTMAITVAGGALTGHYSLAPAPVQPPAPAEAPQPALKPQAGARGARKRQGAVARGAQGRAVTGRASSRRSSNPLSWVAAGVILLVALAGAWLFNVDNVYADMRFQQGQFYTEGPGADLSAQLMGMSYYLDAVDMEPQQDFYYLNLGRSLMSVVDIRRQNPQIPLGERKGDARVEDLLVGNLQSAETFIRQTDPATVQPGTRSGQPRSAPELVLNQPLLVTMSYAEAVLERAHQLSTGNKDHYANLARLHNFWYARLTRDPEQLRQAINWYERGHQIAPQDVTILNEYASAVALMGNYLQSQKDQSAADTYYDQAADLLKQSKQTDPRYPDTDLRIADLLRIRGRFVEATDQYVALLQRNPHALDSQVPAIIDALRDQPDQLRRLHDSYTAALAQRPDDAALHSFAGLLAIRLGDLAGATESFARQTQLQPQSLEAWRNYTLVLSDTQQYGQAAGAAQRLLELLRTQQPGQSVTDLEQLVEFYRQRAGGG